MCTQEAIQTTGLFSTAILEWNGFLAGNQSWPEFKSLFQDAYEVYLHSGEGNVSNLYHGAANAIGGDDDIEEINESLTEIHLAHNANAETTNTELAALRAAVASTRQALVATQQQMAQIAQANTQRQVQTLPAWQPTYPAAY